MLPASRPPVNDLPEIASPAAAALPEARRTKGTTARRRGDQQLGDSQLGERVQSLSLAHLPERRDPLVSLAAWLIGLATFGICAWFLYAQITRRPGDNHAAADAQRADEPPRPAATKASDSSDHWPAKKNSGRPAANGSASAVSTAPPTKGDIILEAKGYIVPAHQILVSPKVSGMIVTLDVEEGRRVGKGDVLAVLESTDYQAECERAKAAARLARERLRELENGNRPEEIKRAEAELGEAEVQMRQLALDYERTKKLFDRGANAQQEFELAESRHKAQQQRVAQLAASLELMKLGPRVERIDVAKAELAQDEADVTKALWRLGNCTIRAPISGTILKKNAEEGNVVNPIAFNGSFSLCEMADLSDLEVDLDIQERDIARVQVGQKCRVRAEAYPQRVYQGHVDRLMPIADRAKGAIPVRVKITIPADEEGVYLKPEMGAIVTFLQDLIANQ
jgi:HlyD family secretion protein